jgi:hypothetical protein
MVGSVFAKHTAQGVVSKGGGCAARRLEAFASSLPPWWQEISKRPCRGGLFETSVSVFPRAVAQKTFLHFQKCKQTILPFFFIEKYVGIKFI